MHLYTVCVITYYIDKDEKFYRKLLRKPSTMIDSWAKFCLLFGTLGLTTTAISANVLTKSVDCECFNTTANANSQDVCRDNVVRCYNTDSDRPAACFVLWATDNITGTVLLFFLFCFVLNVR